MTLQKQPLLPKSSSPHFLKGIIYINRKDNQLQKLRDDFDSCVLTCELQHDYPARKLNVMEELLALSKKYSNVGCTLFLLGAFFNDSESGR